MGFWGFGADLGPKVVPNTQAKGLSGARNTGTEMASSDVVAYLDDDATAEPGWLQALLAPFAVRCRDADGTSTDP